MRYKFRGWHQTAKEMLYDENFGDILRWYREGQPLDIMQYTGLKDKNDVPIYEGDICRTNDNGERFTEVVTWDQEWAGWMFKSDYGTFNAAELRFEWLEVIGNIHENKDLLT